MEYILETNNLTKKYGKFQVLTDINMHIPKNAIYGLIGKNGAGKTTLIRIMTGLQRPTSGTYSIYNIAYNNKMILKERNRISAIIESPAIYSNLSAKDNLIEQYKIIGRPIDGEVDKILELVGLNNIGKKLARYFSLGMRQRLGIAISLCSNPDFLILDEPINGLDPEGIIDIRELLLKLNNNGITILISSHYLDELSKIATYYGFVHDGKIVKEISANDLTKSMRKRIEVKVNEVKDLVKYLELNNISYEVINNNTIYIYDKINLSDIILKLSKTNCIVESITEHEETLENYYMNLIGGHNNE